MSDPLADAFAQSLGIELAKDLILDCMRRVRTTVSGHQTYRSAVSERIAAATEDARTAAAAEFGAGDPQTADRTFEFLASPDARGIVERLLAAEVVTCRDFHYSLDRAWRERGGEDAPMAAKSSLGRLTRRSRSPQADADTPAHIQKDLKQQCMDARAARLATLHEQLAREFTLTMALYLGTSPSTLNTAASRLFSVISTQAREVFAALGDSWNPAPFRTDELERWLSSIEPRVHLLERTEEIRPYLEFEWRLRTQAEEAHALLRAPHLDREVRLTFQEAYVPPWLTAAAAPGRSPAPGAQKVTPQGLYGSIDRTVVIGDPGAGKSTFGHKLCFDLASCYDQRIVAGKLLTPMFVELRQYAVDTGRDPRSLAEYLDTVARTTYQVTPPPGALEYLLSQGRLLIVFDGLDELPTTARRQKVRADIENFCAVYPATHALVTSRVVGYEHTPLDERTFSLYRLCAFDDGQVGEYARRWFGLRPDIPATERERRATRFLEESRRQAGDLRSNPLLLALLCALYREEGDLPRDRPAIYRRCSELLLRTWDASRDLEVQRPLGDHLPRALRHLASHIYDRPELQSGMSEKALVEVLAEYIAAKRTGDLDEAREAAGSFMAFCRDRPWVLVEVGRDERGRPLVAFTHRTFLEYFAADQLVRNSRTPNELAEAIGQRVAATPGAILPQLALQIAHDEREDAADEVLTALLARSSDDTAPGLFERFAVSSLQFLVPAPQTARGIGYVSARWWLDRVSDTGSARSESAAEIVDGFLECLDANVRWLSTGMAEALSEALPIGAKARDAVELLAAVFVKSRGVAGRSANLWASVCQEVAANNSCELGAVRRASGGAAADLLLAGQADIADVVAAHGMEALFDVTITTSSAWRPISHGEETALAPAMLRAALRDRAETRADDPLASNMVRAGELLFARSAPWVPRLPHLRSSPWPEGRVGPPSRLGGDTLFAMLCLALPYAEAGGEWSRQPAALWPAAAALGEMARMRSLVTEDRIETVFSGLELNAVQVAFLESWIRRQISTIGPVPATGQPVRRR